MRPVAGHKRLVAALSVIISFTLATTIIASGLPGIAQSQSRILQQRSSEIESEVAHWAARLKSWDEEERREAVMRLSLLESSAATSALASVLADPSPRVRAAAVAGLAQRQNTSIVPLLAGSLNAEKDVFVRKTAAYALGRFEGTARTAALTAALKDKNPEVRGAAAVALGDHADSAAVAPLTNALSDTNPFVRAQSAHALGVNGSAAAQAVPKLITLLGRDEDSEVKRQAASALGRIADRSALPSLEQARHDRDPYLAQAALDAIRLIEGK